MAGSGRFDAKPRYSRKTADQTQSFPGEDGAKPPQAMVNPVFLRPPEPPSDQGRRARSFLSRRTADLLTLLGFLGLSVALFAGAWRAPTSSVAGTGLAALWYIVWCL